MDRNLIASSTIFKSKPEFPDRNLELALESACLDFLVSI